MTDRIERQRHDARHHAAAHHSTHEATTSPAGSAGATGTTGSSTGTRDVGAEDKLEGKGAGRKWYEATHKPEPVHGTEKSSDQPTIRAADLQDERRRRV